MVARATGSSRHTASEPEREKIELIGTQIKVPGAYWDGRMSDEEKAMLYLCSIREYSALHTFASGAKGQAFELQEMGAAGTGSLEHGDASGEIFWMQYPFPGRVTWA